MQKVTLLAVLSGPCTKILKGLHATLTLHLWRSVLIFAPFTVKTLIFLDAGVVVFVILPWLTPRFFRMYGPPGNRRHRTFGAL